jgi:hypothetical protein
MPWLGFPPEMSRNPSDEAEISAFIETARHLAE